MKKLVYLSLVIVMVVLLTSCGKSKEDVPDQSNEPANQQEATVEPSSATPEPTLSPSPSPDKSEQSKALLDEFNGIVAKAKNAAEMIVFLDANMPKVDQKTADAMFLALDLFYDKNLEKASEPFYKDGIQEKLLAMAFPIDVNKITDKALKQLVTLTLAGKYKLESVEGTIFPIVDFEALKAYFPYLSEPLMDYIVINAIESNNKSSADGGLVISWNELADRALRCEEYFTLYPDGVKTADIKKRYLNGYLYVYIKGIDNSPIYDFESFKLANEVRKSYERMVKEHPDTITGKLISEYLVVLNKTDQIYSNGDNPGFVPAVQKFQDDYPKRVDQLLSGGN